MGRPPPQILGDHPPVLSRSPPLDACNDFLLSICCVFENNPSFYYIEVEYMQGIFAY